MLAIIVLSTVTFHRALIFVLFAFLVRFYVGSLLIFGAQIFSEFFGGIGFAGDIPENISVERQNRRE